MNYSQCPKCGSSTSTYRHPHAKVWCPRPDCGFVLREEGESIKETVSPKKKLIKETLNFYKEYNNLMPMDSDEKDLLIRILEEYDAR